MLGAGKVFCISLGGHATNVHSWMEEGGAGGHCADETLILKRTDVSRKYLAANSSFLQLELQQYFVQCSVSSVYPRSISTRVSTVLYSPTPIG